MLSSIVMEIWFIPIIIVSLCFCFFIRALFSLNFHSSSSHPLPPGPPPVPIIGPLLFLLIPFSKVESLLRYLHAKYGPIITLRLPSGPVISVADRFLAHQALIQNGVAFSGRPKAPVASEILTSNQHNISSAFYGPTWRLLRHNLTSEMLHPTRIKSFSGTRKKVLDMIVSRLKCDSQSNKSIKVIGHLQYAMFCLLVSMCFGEILDDKQVKDIERVQRRLLLSFDRFRMLNFWPRITRILLRKRWNELFQIRKEQEDVLIPLIRARKISKEERLNEGKEDNSSDEDVVTYVDTLLNLEWPEEKRKLHESEIITVCSEFLNAGTDTTTAVLQWILANLVKYPHIQERVVKEIREVMGDRGEREMKEEDLNKLPYLKAVILEGLRRHPPGHFVLPHAVSEDMVLNNYLVPKNESINFMVAEIGWDPKVWENPMEFKPERFLNDEKNGCKGFDITGRKEIKMMPFGTGRRMCPGYILAMLHLEYFVANLVWNFEWKAANGDVDLSEKEEFSVVMKYPLLVNVSPRL